MHNNIYRFYIVGAFLSAVSCLARADYNLPLMIFAYILWKKENERLRVLGLFVFTLFVDIIWMLYWIPFWTSGILGDWEKNIHYVVIFTSLANLIVKVLIIISHCSTQKEDIRREFPMVGNFLKFEDSKR